jgi:uncharacterized glyoxalase superfamily protein PhnB
MDETRHAAVDAPTVVPAVWPSVTCADPEAMIGFLTSALDFVERVAYRDGGTVVHAELLRTGPNGQVGGVMVGPGEPTGTAIHLVVGDADAAYRRAKEAGAAIERELEDTDYGSRQFVLRDPAGGIWSLGTWYE